MARGIASGSLERNSKHKLSFILSKPCGCHQIMQNNYMAKKPADRHISDRQKAGSCQNPLHLHVDLLAFNICPLAWRKCVTRSIKQLHLDRKGVLCCRM